MELLPEVHKPRQIGLQWRRIPAQLGAKGAIGLLLPEPVLRPRTDELHPMRGPCGFEQIKQIVLHLDRMMQLPPKFARIGHPDRIHRAHSQFDGPGRQPRKPLVGQGRLRIGILDDGLEHIARLRPGDGKDAPFRGDILGIDPAELRLLVGDGLVEVILIVSRPSPRRDEVIVVLLQPDDGILRPRRPRRRQA
jgi:hypothetical protein